MGIQEKISASLQQFNMRANNKTTDEQILDLFLTKEITSINMNDGEYFVIQLGIIMQCYML